MYSGFSGASRASSSERLTTFSSEVSSSSLIVAAADLLPKLREGHFLHHSLPPLAGPRQQHLSHVDLHPVRLETNDLVDPLGALRTMNGAIPESQGDRSRLLVPVYLALLGKVVDGQIRQGLVRDENALDPVLFGNHVLHVDDEVRQRIKEDTLLQPHEQVLGCHGIEHGLERARGLRARPSGEEEREGRHEDAEGVHRRQEPVEAHPAGLEGVHLVVRLDSTEGQKHAQEHGHGQSEHEEARQEAAENLEHVGDRHPFADDPFDDPHHLLHEEDEGEGQQAHTEGGDEISQKEPRKEKGHKGLQPSCFSSNASLSNINSSRR